MYKKTDFSTDNAAGLVEAVPERRTGPLAVLFSRLRLEERLILEALERRGVEHELVDTRRLRFRLHERELPYGAALGREISHTRSLYAARLLEFAGVPVVNPARVVETCGDKLLTTLAFERAGVPTPRTIVTLVPEAALDALEELGYPAVLKPIVGSWGRLGARVRDREEAETILEHRGALTGLHHRIAYAQEYVDKPGRDIRVHVLGAEAVAATYRVSDHWRTNTARGAMSARCPVTPELADLALAAARAVGGGVPGVALSVDVLEAPDGRLLANEVNHTPEFHGARAVAGLDLADAYVECALTGLGQAS